MIKAPLIVGYKGEIGSFILQGLLRTMPKALDILCYDLNESPTEKIERIKKSDCIFLCVPMQDTVGWLHAYKAFLKNKIIIEQTSLKHPIYEADDLGSLKIMSMHILFRPSATTRISNNRHVALLRTGKHNSLWRELRYDIEKITEAKVIAYYDYKQHDKDMAKCQALVHRSILCLDNILSRANGATYVSNVIKGLADRIKAGDKTLYNFIQKNKYLPGVIKDFEKEWKNFK